MAQCSCDETGVVSCAGRQVRDVVDTLRAQVSQPLCQVVKPLQKPSCD